MTRQKHFVTFSEPNHIEFEHLAQTVGTDLFNVSKVGLLDWGDWFGWSSIRSSFFLWCFRSLISACQILHWHKFVRLDPKVIHLIARPITARATMARKHTQRSFPHGGQLWVSQRVLATPLQCRQTRKKIYHFPSLLFLLENSSATLSIW